MYAQTIKLDDLDKQIIPLDKAFKERGRRSDVRMRSFRKALGEGPVLSGPSEETLFSTIVHCKEHDRPELLFWENYFSDLRPWYQIGRHPRFSIMKALVDAGQRYREIDSWVRKWRDTPEWMLEALKTSNTQKQFLDKVHPNLMARLGHNGRRYLVTNAFKEKFEKRDFTVEDFFNESNQELRRVMLRVVPMDKVLARMKKIAEDAEGTLYEASLRERWGAEGQHRFLHVTCPSTGQQYLLEVPEDSPTPAAARRWTFNLPVEAEFSKEA
jgi:hypothetical protein